MNSKPSSSISWFSRWTLTPTFMTEDPIAVRHCLVRLLAATNRNSLDTRRALELFSKEHWGLHRFRLKQVLDRMDSRTPLLEALEKKPSLIGDQAMLALRLGQATGTVPAVWNELTLWERPIHTETAKVWRNSKAYWVAVAFAMMIVSLYFAWMIVPSLAYLEREFEFESNKELFDVHQMASFIYLSIAGAILFAICWIVWRLATWHPKSWLRRFAARIGGDLVRQETGLWRLIAMNLASGVSAKSSIEQLALLHRDNCMRRKLNIATKSISEGTNEWQSMVDAKLLHPVERNAITATELSDVQAWTLRHLALRRRENLHFNALRRNMWTQPLVTLLFGSFVLVIAFAVFSTLTQMILIIAERHG